MFFVGDEFQSIYGFRHADVAVFRDRRERAGGGLALTRNYRSRPEVLAAVNHPLRRRVRRRVPAARGLRRLPRPGLRPPGRAARHRQGELRGHGRALAARRGAQHRPPRARARRHRRRAGRARSCSSSPPARTPSGTRRSCAAPGLPTYRATGRGYFGQQQVVDLLAYLRLLHNRYDDEALLTVLASPFVGVSNDALVLIRRAAPRRPLFTGVERELPQALAPRGRAAAARLPPALRPARRRLCAAVARAPVRADRRGARLRPGRARPVGRQAPLRQPAQARAARALVRGAARARHRGLRPLRAPAGGGRRAGARGGRGGGGDGRGAAPDDPRGQGTRVQGRDRRRRGPRPAGAGRRRDPRALRRSLRVQGRRPVHEQAPRRVRLRRGARGARGGGSRRAAAPLLRRDDAGDRPADRLGRARSRAGRRDADRLGAAADRPGRGPGALGRGAGRARARRRASPAAGRAVRPGRRSASRRTSSPRPPKANEQLSLFDAEAGRRQRASPRCCLRSSRCPRRRSTTCARSPTARSRSSSAARTASSPSASRGCASAGPALCRPRRRAGCSRPSSATRCTGCSSRSIRRRPPCPTSSRCGPGTRRRRTKRSSGSQELVEAYCGSALAARLAGLDGVRPSGRSRSSTTASSSTASSTCCHVAERTRARRRLQDERARRAVAGRGGRRRVPDPAARLRARLLPGGGGRGRGRLRVPRAAGRDRVGGAFTRADVPALEEELSAAIARVRSGVFEPRPSECACSGCPALDVVCAGPRLPGRGPRPVPELTAAAQGAA